MQSFFSLCVMQLNLLYNNIQKDLLKTHSWNTFLYKTYGFSQLSYYKKGKTNYVAWVETFSDCVTKKWLSHCHISNALNRQSNLEKNVLCVVLLIFFVVRKKWQLVAERSNYVAVLFNTFPIKSIGDEKCACIFWNQDFGCVR